jgi:hypothetical protein
VAKPSIRFCTDLSTTSGDNLVPSRLGASPTPEPAQQVSFQTSSAYPGSRLCFATGLLPASARLLHAALGLLRASSHLLRAPSGHLLRPAGLFCRTCRRGCCLWAQGWSREARASRLALMPHPARKWPFVGAHYGAVVVNSDELTRVRGYLMRLGPAHETCGLNRQRSGQSPQPAANDP